MQLFTFVSEIWPGALAQAGTSAASLRTMFEQWRQQIPAVEHPGALLALFVIWQLVWIFSIWFASRIFAEEPYNAEYQATSKNAYRVWLLYWATILGSVLLVGLTAGVLLAMKAAGVVLLLIFGAVLLSIGLVFVVPMRVYHIGFGRSLGLFATSFLMTLAIHSVVSMAFRYPVTEQYAFYRRIVSLPPQERKAVAAKLKEEVKIATGQPVPLPGEAEAGDRTKSLADRQTALRTMYQALEEHRLAVQPGDADALARYNEEKKRYEAQLNALRADAAAQRDGGTAAAPQQQ